MLNAVLVSVIVMVVLSLLRINVLFALLIAALTAGVVSGMGLIETTTLMVSGMGGQSNTALSYILLGIFAVMIGLSGITNILVKKISAVFGNKKTTLVLVLAGIACLSQNAIPVHIAFIPILIPPLLALFNKLQLDRRAVAVALTFGLKTPYMTLPIGFGLIYQGIIRDEMIANNMAITLNEVTKAMIIPGIGMIVGLLIAVFITYRKPRVPKPVEKLEMPDIEMAKAIVEPHEEITWKLQHSFTILAIISALTVQIWTQSLVLGALIGIIIMFATRVVLLHEGDRMVHEGVGMMGTIAFIMLISAGYAKVLKETGAVSQLVEQTTGLIGTSPITIAIFILFVGLVVTMGIGSSFGTIPILAALYVPICAAAGISPIATAALIGTAGALGDAGSPASDSTLGPTSGLNADGNHHHIWDTCVPTFMHFNIPLFICGIIAVIVL